VLEPWANEGTQTNMALKCYKNNKKYKCNACDECPLNIKFLHTPQTEQRELVYTMGRIVANRHAGKGTLVGVFAFCILTLLVIIPWPWHKLKRQPRDYFAELQKTIRTLKVSDIDGNGVINCVDYSVTLWRTDKRKFELVYIPSRSWQRSDAHMTVIYRHPVNGPTLIEAQGRDNVHFMDFWGHIPTEVFHVTDLWSDEARTIDYARATEQQRRRLPK
jgi:hypothetical protein